MAKFDTSFLKAEWLRLEEEKKKRKKLLEKHFIFLSLADKYVQYQKKLQAEREKAMRDSMAPITKKLLTPEQRVNLVKAKQQVAEERKVVEEAHQESEKKIRGLDGKPEETKIQEVSSMIMMGCLQFSEANDRTEAAAIAASVKSGLNYFKENPELMEKSGLSPELLEQARMTVEMGKVIEEGQAALEEELASSLNPEGADPARHEANLAAIIKMQLIEPSKILEIKSPELTALQEAEKEAEKKSEKQEEKQAAPKV